MQANNNGDLSGASTSKDGATPIGSIATGAMLIKHGHVSAMNGLNDSSLMNITDPSISEPAAVDDTFKPIDQVRKSKRSHNKTDFFSSDNYAAPPPDGRAIVNTSLIKVATQNQLRGRSPLTNVANKQNGTSAEIEAQQRRNMAVVADNGFHLYQKKAPQTYYGEGRLIDFTLNYMICCNPQCVWCWVLPQTTSTSSRTRLSSTYSSFCQRKR